MAHTIYDRFVLEDKLEDLLATAVDLNNYVTADYSLAEAAGTKKKIHKYTSTGNVEDLAMGVGNSSEIEVSFTEDEYTVGVTQGNFNYYDEQEMSDPMVVDAGLKGLSERMINDFTNKAIAEYGKANLIKYGCTWTYDNIVDAIALYPYESEKGLFLLINPAQLAAIRKNLKDSLQYVEANVRTGYIGTVCGADVVICKAVPAGEAYLATKAAVTAFIKKGVEVEQERDANTRKNKVFARKVAVVALTDATRVIKLTAEAEPQPVPPTPEDGE